MTWQPISESELKLQLQSALEQMSEVERKKFASIQTPIYRIPCRRNNQTADEQIFVVAHSKNKILLFDDVEDEFGVADLIETPPRVLKEWDLVGDLATALHKL
jgi:hypothetical protein